MMLAQLEPSPDPQSAAVAPLPPSLSVVIPARDEERRLGASLLRLARYLEARSVSAEVIVVDDGSRDATALVAEGHSELFDVLRVVRPSGAGGKGAAIRAGWLAARGALVLTLDVGSGTPMEAFERLEASIRRGSDIAIGARSWASAPASLGARCARVAARGLATVAATLVPTGIRDTQTGFKLVRGSIARELARLSEIDGRAFDVEVLALARQIGLRITEIELPSRCPRRPSWREVAQVPRTVADLVRIRRRIVRQRRSRLPDLHRSPRLC